MDENFFKKDLDIFYIEIDFESQNFAIPDEFCSTERKT